MAFDPSKMSKETAVEAVACLGIRLLKQRYPNPLPILARFG